MRFCNRVFQCYGSLYLRLSDNEGHAAGQQPGEKSRQEPADQ
jgi:hypothetical protein